MEASRLGEVEARYRAFLAGEGQERVFAHRFEEGRDEVDFCICRSSIHGPVENVALHLRYGVLMGVLSLPWSWPKVSALRMYGARIGGNVFISQRAFVDPLYPQLLEVGDDVLVGFDAKIFFHEITQEAYRIGRVSLGTGCIIGAGAIVRPGITIGERAEVGALTAVTKSVDPGCVVFGVPARVVKRPKAAEEGAPLDGD